MALHLDSVMMDESIEPPRNEIGNVFATFGIGRGIATAGSGHSGVVPRPLPDRPSSEWPNVHFDEMNGVGEHIGPGTAWVTALLIQSRPHLDLQELRDRRDDVLEAAKHEPNAEAVIDALLREADTAELMEALAPGSVHARAAAARTQEAHAAIVADAPWLNRSALALPLDSAAAVDRAMRLHLIFDINHPLIKMTVILRALAATGDHTSRWWPMVEVLQTYTGTEPAMTAALLRIAGDLETESPTDAIHVAANVIAIGRDENVPWPSDALAIIEAAAGSAHPDYQAWLQKLPRAPVRK